MGKETILVVDDEKEIRDLVKIYLQNEDYNVLQSSNGLEALSLIETEEINLIILDVMMPKLDGIATCIKIREKINVPIIMLSAKSEDIDKILGLTTGADDYVSKPFNPLELIARVKSLLRRSNGFNNPATVNKDDIIIDDLIINKNTHEVKKGEKDIKLTPREFDILQLLCINKGIVFSMEKIYQKIWNEDALDCNNTVMVHIRKIREKLEDDPRKPRYIKTIWGVGYKIEA